MNLASYLDATILKPMATVLDFDKLCSDANLYHLKAICVPPSLVCYCKDILKNSEIKLATVVGFPNGYQLLKTKLSETESLVSLGADEIDFVINRFYLAENNFTEIYKEAKSIIDLCKEMNVVSKWIIESSTLENEQLEKICHIANEIKPDYVKTSTGVHGNAIVSQVEFLKKRLTQEIQIKASGGIQTRAQALEFVNAGATRLGISNYKAILDEN